ncbi:MAG: hypothetical protein KDA95_11225, partial [Acidimicrobiales bacterium]|nr:hypothetical protein [Acidimicrobiales bacterium]
MTVGNGGRAAVLLASKTEEAKFGLRRQLEAVGLWLIGAPSGRGWLAAVGRLTRAADLLVVVVGDQSSMSRMRAAALAARCYSIPLIVVEVAPGDSAAM